MVAPFTPHEDNVKIPAATILIWPTDEYAISAFRSVCRRQIILVISVPHMQKVIRGREIFLAEINKNIIVVRARPYPPNFKRIAARIIDPAIGAST